MFNSFTNVMDSLFNVLVLKLSSKCRIKLNCQPIVISIQYIDRWFLWKTIIVQFHLSYR